MNIVSPCCNAEIQAFVEWEFGSEVIVIECGNCNRAFGSSGYEKHVGK